ncbi:sporulation protein [Micromonospora sp. NPDC003197]
MVFKRMLGAFGVGGPSVDTVLANPNTRPGLPLQGQVNLAGGSHDVHIEQLTVSLVTRIEVEGGDAEYDAVVEFLRVGVGGPLHLAAGQQVSVPFQVLMPWETPVTDLNGQRLHGMTMGLRTEVAVSGAIDKGDLDPVYVYPLPVQERIMEAFGRLGFQFKGADLERGQLYGVPQTLPFYQEIEFFAPPQYHGIAAAELTFVATPHGVEVILEFDKRSGMFGGDSHDAISRYTVDHAEADTVDWVARVDGWVRQAVDRHQAALAAFGGNPYGAPAGYPHAGGYPPAYGHGGHYEEHHERGSGMGGVVAGAVGGAALGFAGGMLIDEVFDGDDESDEADGEDE